MGGWSASRILTAPLRAARWRLALACVLLLLLAQPVLCVAHCLLSAPPADGPFLCHLSAPEQPDPPLIPPFWPGLLFVLALLLLAAAPPLRLAPAAPLPPPAPGWAPPTPPPRHRAA